MTRAPRPSRALEPRARGFTLVELLVALAITGGFLFVLSLTFFRTSDESDRVRRLVEYRQSARAGLQLIERDVRMSGSGWGRNPVNVLYNGTGYQLWGITPGHGPALNDSIQIMGAWSTQTRLATDMPSASSILKVTDPSGFADGDLVVVTDGSNAHLFQSTGVNTASGIIQHNPASPWNPPGGHNNWPAGGYAAGAQCYRITLVTYRVDSLNFGRPCLVRQEFNGQPQVVSYDLNKFQVWYRMQDSTLTRDPVVMGVGVALIDKVVPRIAVRVTDRRRPTVIDSVWTEVRPRTFD